MESNESVYDLITLLCENLTNNTDVITVKKYRKRAFETLLKRSYHKEENKDPFESLGYFLFEMRIKNNISMDDRRIVQEFRDCIDDIWENSYFKESDGKSILQLLIALRNSSSITHFMNNPNSFIFSKNSKIFEQINLCNTKYNPYILKKKKGSFFKINDLESYSSSLDIKPSTIFFKFKDPGIQLKTSKHSNESDLTNLKLNVIVKPKTLRNEKKENILGVNWENFGHKEFLPDSSLFIESVNLLCCKVMSEDKKCSNYRPKIISYKDFLRDIKLATISIKSESFIRDKTFIFTKSPDLTVENVSPETMESCLSEFLECGSCVKQLERFIIKNSLYKQDEFLFKALCTCIGKILRMFTNYVMTFHDTSILQFKLRTSYQVQQIIFLAKFLRVHPHNSFQKDIPSGSKFLDYLYKTITEVTCESILMMLIYILRHCCEAYFKQLNNWIYNGNLTDLCNELFIRKTDSYQQNTKTYFDKAFLLKKNFVPEFLRGFEEDILLCGKYTILLKSFKTSHPLFSLLPSKIKICLSFKQIKDLCDQCLIYKSNAIEICGEFISIKKIYEEKLKEKETLQRKTQEILNQNIEKWKTEQENKISCENEKKKKNLEELKQQMNEYREMKLAKKCAEITEEKYYLEQGIEMENKRIAQENEQLKKRIQCYEDLNKLSPKIDNHETILEVNLIPDDVMKMSHTSETFITPEDGIFSLKNDSTKENVQIITVEIESDESPNDIKCDKLKKSASDYFNANLTNDEFNRNKKKNLGSHLSENFDSEVIENNQTSDENIIDNGNIREISDIQKNNLENIENSEVKIPLADRQLNKLKIMGSSDFDKKIETNIIEINTSELTELQKNRMKVMSVEFDLFRGNSNECVDKSKNNLNLDLTRNKNKKKVLESEYGIFIETPMSTDSDNTPNPEDRDNECSNSVLEQPEINKLQINEFQETIINETTPEISPISSKQFLPLPDTHESSEVTITESFDKKTTVQTKLNAKKKMKNVFELSLENNSECAINEKISMNELGSMDATTLTKYLKLSIAIPLNMHLEILNNEILRIFLVDLKILDHFKSLRNYLFLMNGEFGSCLCDNLIACVEHDQKPSVFLNFYTLNMLLKNSLKSTNLENDENAKRLSFCVNSSTEQFDKFTPNFLSMLTLGYNVDWPLNLILNGETLEQYGNIFRYLLKLRRVSWLLEESFHILKFAITEKGKSLTFSPQYFYVQQIRYKFTHFITTLQNHITSNAMQTTWKTFKNDLMKVKSMEDLYRKHTDYIKRILFFCMLNRRSTEFRNNIENILKVILKFCYHLKLKTWKKDEETMEYVHPNFAKMQQDEKNFLNLVNHTVYLGNKIIDHGYQKELEYFINLINFNNYYNYHSLPQ